MMKNAWVGSWQYPAILVTLFVVLLFPSADISRAESDTNSDGDLRFVLRGIALKYEFDDSNNTGDSGLGGLARAIYKKRLKESTSIELNVFQAYFPKAFAPGQSNLSPLSDVERSGSLEIDINDAAISRLAIDRLNIRWSGENTDVTFGRQAINLANTFYFTPNDFFAPFSAQAFYRVYKPGVDAVRTDTSINELDLVTLMAVAGYEVDPDNDNGWSDSPSSSRTSLLAQVSLNRWNTQWIALGGKLRDAKVIGAAVQGEIGGWLGIRAEGHRLKPDAVGEDDVTEYVLGLEHLWQSSFSLRLEYFYHGAGATSTDDYITLLASGKQISYLARRYIAVGAGYEFTPLIRGEAVLVSNRVDDSRQWAFYAVRSMSDESELALNVALPSGKKSTLPIVESEYGLAPRILSMEYRYVF